MSSNIDPRSQIIRSIRGVINQEKITLETPEREEFGDYSTSAALKLKTQKLKTGGAHDPRQIAEKIKEELAKDVDLMKVVEKIEVAGPGFINFRLKNDALFDNLIKIDSDPENYGKSSVLKGKKILVEFAHPNTHKELHIGHMRTLILGESLARIFSALLAEVFRANYQGDIGPHVAKAIWGTKKIMGKRGLTWEEAGKLTIYQKARLLGEGYVVGNKEYEGAKTEIDALNSKLYKKDPDVITEYETTRKWSLEYYGAFYKRFDVEFDRLYFETEVGDLGRQIVLKNIGKVFEESEGAVVFKGEKYGLHTRVFVTRDGNPTYEAKDMALAPMQFSDFPFDKNIHVVANEQKGYFEVVIKALELIDPKFKGREYHLPMGMVQLVGQKMSSRSGIIVAVDKLLDDVKKQINPLISEEIEDKDKVAEMITIGAVKYSMLKVNPVSDVLFDVKESVSLEGNSGPYLQYTYARTRSVLAKAGEQKDGNYRDFIPNEEELSLMRTLIHFPEVVESAAVAQAPNLICNYLYDLAQKFNAFYNEYRIIDPKEEKSDIQLTSRFRLSLTSAVSNILKSGLSLLGIQFPQRM